MNEMQETAGPRAKSTKLSRSGAYKNGWRGPHMRLGNLGPICYPSLRGRV